MWIRVLAVLLMPLAGYAPTAADAKRPTLNVLEQRKLPKYCWGKHVDERYSGKTEYEIPRTCGRSMNHVCPGHIYLVAAQRATLERRDRKFYAQKAIGDFQYTKRHMNPQCPLGPELDAAIALARILEKRR